MSFSILFAAGCGNAPSVTPPADLSDDVAGKVESLYSKDGRDAALAELAAEFADDSGVENGENVSYVVRSIVDSIDGVILYSELSNMLDVYDRYFASKEKAEQTDLDTITDMDLSGYGENVRDTLTRMGESVGAELLKILEDSGYWVEKIYVAEAVGMIYGGCLDQVVKDEILGDFVKLSCDPKNVADSEARKKAGSALLKLIEVDNAYLQKHVVIALGSLNDPTTIDYLIKLYGETKYQVVKWAIEGALSEMGEAAREAIIKVANDWNSGVSDLAYTLSYMTDEDDVDMLIGLLSSPNSTFRKVAATCLGNIGDPKAVDALIKILDDIDFYVRQEAVLSLGYIGDPKAADALNNLLQKGDSGLEIAITNALGKLGSASSSDVLIQELNDPDEYVRMNALKSLAKIGDARAYDFAIEALNDPSYQVRSGAAYVLGEIGNLKALDLLIAIIYDEDEMSDVQSAAVTSLIQLGDHSQKTVDAFVKSLESWVGLDQYSAIDRLGEIGNPSAVPILTKILTNSGREYGDLERANAATALGKIGDIGALDSLIFVLDTESNSDWILLCDIIEVLEGFGSTKAVDVLIKALGYDVEFVSKDVVVALTSLTGQDFGTDQEKWEDWWDANRSKF